MGAAGWVFAPAWSALDILMGISAWLVWRVRGFAGGGIALVLFVVQLAVNVPWSWLFFAWHQGGLAFADALVPCWRIVTPIILFRRIGTLAAAPLLHYQAWSRSLRY